MSPSTSPSPLPLSCEQLRKLVLIPPLFLSQLWKVAPTHDYIATPTIPNHIAPCYTHYHSITPYHAMHTAMHTAQHSRSNEAATSSTSCEEELASAIAALNSGETSRTSTDLVIIRGGDRGGGMICDLGGLRCSLSAFSAISAARCLVQRSWNCCTRSIGEMTVFSVGGCGLLTLNV